jgi:hypothetical protein
MISNNVIAFPKAFNGPRNGDELSPEDISKNVDMMKQFHIQETISQLAPMIFNQLEVAGFQLSDEDEELDIKDGAFVIESLRSMMCKHYGIYHPFQEISENVFSPDEDDSGGLKIVDSLNIIMKKNESN